MSTTDTEITRPNHVFVAVALLTTVLCALFATESTSRVVTAVALGAALVTASMLARSAAWRRKIGVGLVGGISGLPRPARTTLLVLVGITATRIIVPLPSILGWLQTAATPLAVICLPLLAGWGGWLKAGQVNSQIDANARNAASLAAVFGVPVSVIETGCGITETRDGGLIVGPVAPAVAAKVGGNRAQIEAQVASVMPHLELGDAGPTRIVLKPVTTTTLDRRVALEASGGLLAGSSASPAPYPSPSSAGLTLSPEDLE